MGRTSALTLALGITLLAPSIASAHPRRSIRPDGTARTREFVASHPNPHGLVFARQVLAANAHATAQVQSKVIYLNHDGVTLTPGDNDSRTQTSSIVTEQADVGGWDIDADSWAATVACVQNMYAAFDVTVTDQDPGNVPHIEALIGGSPADVGLPDNVAGVSPFTADCSVIESSIAFTFTDVLNDDPQTICEVVSQEIAHSFGLDHEMLPEDPMTYLDYSGDRAFQDDMATCGEYDGRMCGINGSVCREKQNSVQLLTARLGAAGGSDPTAAAPGAGGCAAGGAPGKGATGGLVGLALLALARRRRLR